MQQCPCITKKNKPCPIPGEKERNGFCHVHDPRGKFRKKHGYKKRKRTPTKLRKAKRKASKQLKNELIKEIKAGNSSIGKKRQELRQTDEWQRLAKNPSERACERCKNTVAIRDWMAGKRRCGKCQKGGNGQIQVNGKWAEYATDAKETVYVFHLGFDGVYKVGKSRNWKRRLHALRAGNPRIEPVLVVRGYGVEEKAIHKAWHHWRLERETFKFPEKDEFVSALQGVMEIAGQKNIVYRSWSKESS